MEPVNPTAPPINPPITDPVPPPPSIEPLTPPASETKIEPLPIEPPSPPATDQAPSIPTATPVPTPEITVPPINPTPEPTKPANNTDSFVFKPEDKPSSSGTLKKVVVPLGITLVFLFSIPLIRNLLNQRRQLNAPAAEVINCDNPKNCSASDQGKYYTNVSQCRRYFNCTFESGVCTCKYYECFKNTLKPSPVPDTVQAGTPTPTLIPWPNVKECSFCQTNSESFSNISQQDCLDKQYCDDRTKNGACAVEYVPGCPSGSSCGGSGQPPAQPTSQPTSGQPSNTPIPTQPINSGTPVPSACGCTTVRAYNSSNNEISLSQLPAGQTVKLTVGGTGSNQWRARLKVHTGNAANLIPPALCSSGQLVDGWCETTEYLHQPDNKGGFFINYSVPETAGSYQVVGQICCGEGSRCNWSE